MARGIVGVVVLLTELSQLEQMSVFFFFLINFNNSYSM